MKDRCNVCGNNPTEGQWEHMAQMEGLLAVIALDNNGNMALREAQGRCWKELREMVDKSDRDFTIRVMREIYRKAQGKLTTYEMLFK